MRGVIDQDGKEKDRNSHQAQEKSSLKCSYPGEPVYVFVLIENRIKKYPCYRDKDDSVKKIWIFRKVRNLEFRILDSSTKEKEPSPEGAFRELGGQL